MKIKSALKFPTCRNLFFILFDDYFLSLFFLYFLDFFLFSFSLFLGYKRRCRAGFIQQKTEHILLKRRIPLSSLVARVFWRFNRFYGRLKLEPKLRTPQVIAGSSSSEFFGFNRGILDADHNFIGFTFFISVNSNMDSPFDVFVHNSIMFVGWAFLVTTFNYRNGLSVWVMEALLGTWLEWQHRTSVYLLVDASGSNESDNR